MKELNKRTLLITLIVLSIIPAILLVRFPSLVSLKTIALYASAICGYVGIATMLWSYVLGAKSVAGLVFKDLAPVLSIHKWLGKYGTLAIFLHPIFVIYSYGESWLYAFLPHVGTQFERHVTLGRIAFMVILIIWVSSALLRSKVAFRPWRYIHLLVYIALPFAFLHVPDVGSQFMRHEIIKAYLFGMGLVYVGFTLLKVRGMLNLDKTAYRIIMQRLLVDEDPSIYLVQLRPQKNGSGLAPRPGQYVYLKDGFISEEHPFSVLDYDENTGDITIAYRTFGRFTTELAKRRARDTIYLGGPYGEFTGEVDEEPETPVVFIAGGIGVTPMVRHLIENTRREQWLFYANRTHSSAMIVPELRKLLGARLVTIFSRDQPGIGDEQGHFSAEIARKHLADPTAYHYYICGADAMMDTCREELRLLGIPSGQIHSEAFSW